MRYKIKKTDSAPDITMQLMGEYRKCYLGVSINNPFFRERHLGLLLKWISTHFDECIIIVGDYLHRINETIIYGKNGEEAIASGIYQGDQICEKLDIALSLLPEDKFVVYRWRQFLDLNPKALDIKQDLTNLFDTNKGFHDGILKSCTEFVDRLFDREKRLSLSKDEAIEKSKEYLLEEMAVFSILIDQGYKVQVYPGTQLQILKDLASKKIQVPINLMQGIYVDLTVKKIKR